MTSTTLIFRLTLIILSMPVFHATAQVPDTVYSAAVTTTVLLDGQPLDSASVGYTLIDTLNGNVLLVRQGVTDSLGRDVADSLPVLKHPTGIPHVRPVDKHDKLIVTNNGNGSVHFIRFTSDAKQVSKQAYIINLAGQRIATIPLEFNSLTKTYDAVWRGQNINEGIYLFQANTSDGMVGSKIKHIPNRPSVIDYSATPEEKEEIKSTPELKDGELAVSPYKIHITHEGLEDFIDTVYVQEDTPHDFIFNVNGVQYADGDVWGQIFFADNGQPVNSVHVEYKRYLDPSLVFTTTAPNSVYNIQVPVFYEPLNPGETKYLVTLTPTTVPFIEQVDTVLVSPGTNGFVHYVSTIPEIQTQDIVGIVRHAYSKNPESGVVVRVINRDNGELIEEDITSSDGAYAFNDIPAGTHVEFELGKSGQLWMVNNEYDIPDEVLDTLVTFNRYFYPSTVEVPQVGANTYLYSAGYEIAEITGQDYINFEEVLRDIDYMWANGTDIDYWSARTWIQDNFYQGNSPITTANTQRNITANMQENYDPYSNYYPGQLGWNVNFGQGNTTIPLFAATDYGVTAVIGGEMMITGLLDEYIKEMEGRRLVLGPVSSRVSFMNPNPAMPDEKDRAYVHLILINQKGRFASDHETFSLKNITSNEPDTGAIFRDLPGNRPHCRGMVDRALVGGH